MSWLPDLSVAEVCHPSCIPSTGLLHSVCDGKVNYKFLFGIPASRFYGCRKYLFFVKFETTGYFD